MCIGVEIGIFDHDVILALNYMAVLKVSFALISCLITLFFNFYIVVDRSATHDVPPDAFGDKLYCSYGVPMKKVSQVALIFA